MVFLAESDSEAAGRAVGSLILPLIAVLYGISKCHAISLRPEANRKCAQALLFVFIALFIFTLYGGLVKVFPAFFALTGVRIFLGLPSFALLGLAIVFGILGLVEYAQTEGRYKQGRTQAVWALVLSCLMLASIGVGITQRVIHQMQGNQINEVASTPGQEINNESLNFSFSSPGKPWTQVDFSKINKDSKLSLMRRRPEGYFMIIAENLGSDSQLDNEQLAELGKANMEASATSTRLIEKKPYRINNLDGILVLREATLKGYDFLYVQWFLMTNGFAYQLIAYCKYEDRPNLENELRQVLSGFKLIDPNRLASSKERVGMTSFVSPSHFYTVEVAHSVWHDYASLKKNVPEAEFGGSRGDSCFIVIPVWLGGQKTGADDLATGLLSSMNIKYTDAELVHRKKINEGDTQGLEFDFQRTIDSKLFKYRIRTIRRGEFGYLLAAWTVRNKDVDSILDDALDRVKIMAPVTTIPKNQLHFNAQDLKNQAEVNNEIGLFYYNAGEYERALPFFKTAAADGSRTYLGNALLTLCHLDRPQEGLDYMNGLPVSWLTPPEIQVYQAYFQSKSSLVAEAITNYAQVFARGYRNESDFGDYIDLLISTTQYNRALQETKEYLAAGDSASVRLLLADIYRAIPDYESALKLLNEEHAKTPYKANVTRKLVRTLLDAGKPNEALALCEALIKDDSRSFGAYFLKGQCELNLKWYREAKTSFEMAAKLEPSNEDVKSNLDYVSGLLGEGSNSMLKTPIDPVRLPMALTNMPVALPSQDYARDYGCYYQEWIKAIAYASNVEYKATDYLKIQILDATGVTAFSTIQMIFDPLNEDLYVNSAQVFDSNGKLFTTIKPSDCYVIDDSTSSKASRKKILNLPVAGLQPGCKISLTITRRSTGKFDEFPFFRQSLSRLYPALISGVYLQGGNGLTVRTTSGIKRETFQEGVFLSLTNPLVAHWEPLQADVDSFLPMVWIADDAWSWSRLATNYLASIHDRLLPDETVRFKVQQLVGSLSDEGAKIAVLSRFVQTNCVYKAIEFGRHSRIPASAVETLHKAYGDCKDLAVLFQQMAQTAGIPASLALVSSDQPICTNLPSLDQFDHMIVAINLKGVEKFIDCTSKGNNLTNFIPVGLAGQQALVLDAANPHLSRLPDYPADGTRIEIEQHARLTDAVNLSVDETVKLTGVYGAYMREYLLGITPAFRQESVLRDMEMGSTAITNFVVNALDDPAQPLQIKYTFLLPNQFQQTQGGLVGKLRSGLELYYLRSASVAHRQTPFEFHIPIQLERRTYFILPEGYQLLEKPSITNIINTQFLTFRSQRDRQNGQLNLFINIERPTKRYGADDFSAYHDAEAEVLSAMDPEVVLQKGKTN